MLGLSLGLGYGHNSGAAAYSAEATALFAAMSVEPDSTRKGLIDDCIAGLVADGIWARLDWLSLTAAHDAQAGRLNWINPAQVATAVNAPSFTVDRGYAGDGATSYLNTNFNPVSAASPKMSVDDTSMFMWLRSTGTTGFKTDMGNARLHANMTSQAGLSSSQVNADTSYGGANGGGGLGLSILSRNAFATFGLSRNGGAFTAWARDSSSVADGAIFVGGRNASTTGGASFAAGSTSQFAAFGVGQSLSDAGAAALHSRLSTYLTAIGAA